MSFNLATSSSVNKLISQGKKVLALSGGVGGAKLALGLSRILPPENLTIVCNTADDFEHLGFPISPDLDTVMYTLAGLNNTTLGWGLAGETWQFMSALKELGSETWFQLGDKDLATHTERRRLLSEGDNLTQVTQKLSAKLGVKHPIVPMSNDRIQTLVHTGKEDLAFQHYFVREQCQPEVSGFTFNGIEQASLSEPFLNALKDKDLAAIIICPSNPFVSVDPIISISKVRELMVASAALVIAVSPIVGGTAIKGPAAKMMAELNLTVSPESVLRFYGDLLDGFVIDTVDSAEKDQLASLLQSDKLFDKEGVSVTRTVMKTDEDKIALAQFILDEYISL